MFPSNKTLALLLVWYAAVFTAFVFCVVGWIKNVIAFIGMLGEPVNAMFIARLVGIPFFPLGWILGWFA